jgi:hypothetical protein
MKKPMQVSSHTMERQECVGENSIYEIIYLLWEAGKSPDSQTLKIALRDLASLLSLLTLFS